MSMEIKFVQARYYTKGRNGVRPNLILIHDMEWRESGTTAEACAAMFASPSSPKGSAHYNVDNNSIVQSVHDKDRAWGAPGINMRALHIEHAGFAKQSRSDWLDAYSLAMLKLSAELVAGLCKTHSIRPIHLNNAQLRSLEDGIVGHNQCTEVFGPKGGHWDPGPNFPWDVYMGFVRQFYDGTVPAPPTDGNTVMSDVVYVRPEPPAEPSDGILAVAPQGVFPIPKVQWDQLSARATPKPTVFEVPRWTYRELVKLVKP